MMSSTSTVPVVYQRRVAGFPRLPFLLSAASASGLYWFGGIGIWGSLLFAWVQFSLMVGMRFYKLFYKTVPRDLKVLWYVVKVLIALRQKKAQRKMTFDFFSETAAKYPNKPAIVVIGEPDRTLTFKELEDYVNRIANYFSSLGVKRGDCIALVLENSPEIYAFYLGLAKLGAVSALINTNLRQESLLHCVKVSDCIGLVFSSSLSEPVSQIWDDLNSTVKGKCFSVCGESSLSGAKNLDQLLRGVTTEPPPPLPERTVSDVIVYVYTSGTTGMPKPCNVDDSKLFRSPKFFAYAGGISSSDCVYSILPLYHSHGLVHNGGPMIYYGATLVIRKKFSARNFWTDCAKYGCTMVCTIGELSRYILAQPAQPTDTQHSVRLIITAGLRKEIWEQFQSRFSVPHIIEFYGSTEGNFGFFNLENKPGSIGGLPLFIPTPMRVKFLKLDPATGDYIRDENGFCVESGLNEPGEAVGEITPRTPYYGYRDRENSEKKILCNCFKKEDAYFKTGDVMRVDEEGWVYFCDRTGDTFRWKGENVSTAEVEARIATVLGLTDVVVYGVEVPGNEGRAGMAAIVGTPDTVDLSDLPRQLSLSLPPYAVPLFVRLIEAAELTGTFKLRKVNLRKEGFNLSMVSDDPLYILRGQSYVSLTEELYKDLKAGNIRL